MINDKVRYHKCPVYIHRISRIICDANIFTPAKSKHTSYCNYMCAAFKHTVQSANIYCRPFRFQINRHFKGLSAWRFFFTVAIISISVRDGADHMGKCCLQMGGVSINKDVFLGVWISVIKIRRSHDRLIFMMEIARFIFKRGPDSPVSSVDLKSEYSWASTPSFTLEWAKPIWI